VIVADLDEMAEGSYQACLTLANVLADDDEEPEQIVAEAVAVAEHWLRVEPGEKDALTYHSALMLLLGRMEAMPMGEPDPVHRGARRRRGHA
jgi:hypothetical protein